MSIQALSIAQAAEELGVSTRTIRRFIKARKLKAELVNGTFGPEYRIAEIPADLKKQPPAAADKAEPDGVKHDAPAATLTTVAPTESPDQILVMLKDLQDKNTYLAAQLGAATERIRNLEAQVKQIAAPSSARKSWWQRLMSVFRSK